MSQYIDPNGRQLTADHSWTLALSCSEEIKTQRASGTIFMSWHQMNYSFKITGDAIFWHWFPAGLGFILRRSSCDPKEPHKQNDECDQRRIGMQRALSLCFNTFSSSYHSITNLSAWTDVIFLPCSDQIPLPPRVSTTLLAGINAGPMEAGTKTVITQKAANSWAITAYFIQCCK